MNNKKETMDAENRKAQTVFSMFSNTGLVVDYDSGQVLTDDDGDTMSYRVNDLLVSTDLTRFIPSVVQTIVREALEPNLLIVPNLFTPLNIPNGRIVQIGAIGAMAAAEVPETGEYPTQDLDLDGGKLVATLYSNI